MDSADYNPEKKALPIVSILFSILGLIGAVVAFTLDNFTEALTSTTYLIILSIAVVLFIAALFCAAAALKKKCGSLKLARAAQIISVIAVLIFVALNAIGMFV